MTKWSAETKQLAWPPKARARAAAAWTPERRAAQAEIMRARIARPEIQALVHAGKASVSEWTGDVGLLLHLARAGHTYEQIAQRMGRTRNEIAGKVRRLITVGELEPRGGTGGRRRTTKADLRAAGLAP